MNQSSKTIRLVVRLIIVLLMTFVTFATFAAVAPATAQDESDVIRIYTSWPLQGAFKLEGDSMLDAVNLALTHYLEDHNGQGPGGFTIEIVATDDASSETGAWDGTVEAENAERCVNDPQCMVYLATFNSGAAKVSMRITNTAGIVQISPANTYPGLTKPWDTGEPEIYRPSGEINYFRTNAADDAQGWAGAAWAQCLGYENVYILHDLQLYGQGLADAFEQRADEIGLAIAGREGVDSIDTDFQALLTNVRESGADLVYGGFVIDSGGPQVIQQMFDLGLFDDGTDFMGPDGLVNPALVDEIGGADVGSGQIVLTFPGLAPSQLTSEAGLRFLENFQEEYAYEPSAWSTYAYQSMQVALYAIEQAGEADRGAILEAVRNIDEFEGITGTFGFDENGDPTLTAMGGNIVEEGEIIFQGSISPNMNESCDM